MFEIFQKGEQPWIKRDGIGVVVSLVERSQWNMVGEEASWCIEQNLNILQELQGT